MVLIEFLIIAKSETSSSIFVLLFFTMKLIRVKRMNVTKKTNQAK